MCSLCACFGYVSGDCKARLRCNYKREIEVKLIVKLISTATLGIVKREFLKMFHRHCVSFVACM